MMQIVTLSLSTPVWKFLSRVEETKMQMKIKTLSSRRLLLCYYYIERYDEKGLLLDHKMNTIIIP